MTWLTAEDWGLFEYLAGESGDLLDRLKALRYKFGSSCITDSPVVLISGCDDAAYCAIVKHCFGSEALRSSKTSGMTPVIVSNKATVLPPILASFPRIVSPQLHGQIIILAHWPTAVPASVLVQLQEIPNLALFTLVGRLGQPLSVRERKLAATLAGVAATAKVIFVGFSGEDASRDELAELSAYSKIVMQQTGFAGTRMIASRVWFPYGTVVDSSLTVSDPIAFANLSTGEYSASSIEAAHRIALLDILRDIRAMHDACQQTLPVISEQDAAQLTKDFDHYLDLLGGDLLSEVQRWSLDEATTKLCQYVRTSIQHWGAHITTEGHWLNHVETLRPGTQQLLLAQLDNALTVLDVKRAPRPAANQIQSAISSIKHVKSLGLMQPIDLIIENLRELWSRWQGTQTKFMQVAQVAKYGAVGLTAGLACYMSLTVIFSIFSCNGFIFELTRFIAFFLAAILGYSYAQDRFFQAPVPSMSEDVNTSLQIFGWKQIKNQLTLWFAEYIRKQPQRTQEQIDSLILKLGTVTHKQEYL